MAKYCNLAPKLKTLVVIPLFYTKNWHADLEFACKFFFLVVIVIVVVVMLLLSLYSTLFEVAADSKGLYYVSVFDRSIYSHVLICSSANVTTLFHIEVNPFL